MTRKQISRMNYALVSDTIWQGGGFIDRDCLVEFDALVQCAEDVALCPTEYLTGLDVFNCWLHDSKPTTEELKRASVAAEWVAAKSDEGDRVLVTCLGLNRSGLVVALALRELGYDPEEAIQMVKRARGPFALSNRYFVEVIRG